MEYLVRWTIDIDADTPEDAARQAREYQLDPDAIVGVFDVAPRHGIHSLAMGGKVFAHIDLDEMDGKV